MSAFLLLVISIIILIVAYVTYGSWLAKQWGVDNDRKTPAHTLNDGVDYVPAKAPVLLGHHFASIAGAGPINGPIQAAVFGWVPVALWILIGGIFFGAVQDFSSLFASIRHEGKSIGIIVEKNIGKTGKRLFLAFAWLTLLLVIAAFADIVANTFNGVVSEKLTAEVAQANGSTATASLLFMVLSVVFGFAVYRRNMPLGISSVVGVVLLGLCIWAGLVWPLAIGKNFWLGFIMVYIIIASVTPVWILLQPRDYLNSFLLYAMMLAAFIGIVVKQPVITLPAYFGWGGINGNQMLFPMLFITVACGAISGFHSLVGSGTTAKQLDTEKDSKLIGYGGMLIECGLAIIALIAVGSLFADGKMPAGTPPTVFATAVAGFTTALGVPHQVAYTVITLAISAFALTSLDTATRLARFIFQEFFVDADTDVNTLSPVKKFLVNKYVSTIITVLCGGLMAVGGYLNIWPLFGAANQLLAGLALLAVAAWLGNIGKNNKMFFIPMGFMLIATLTALVISIKNNIVKIAGGNVSFGVVDAATPAFVREGFQVIIGALLLVLAVILAIHGIRTLVAKKKVAN